MEMITKGMTLNETFSKSERKQYKILLKKQQQVA